MSDNNLVYVLDDKIYINLTNMCTNDCIFCLRNDKDDVCGQKLWLDNESVTAKDVIEQFEKKRGELLTTHRLLSDELIFCGYGEPMLKFEVLKETAQYIKNKYPTTKIRVNTNGHANFIYKKNLIEELKGLIDEFSVSLNGTTQEEYNELSRPKFSGAYDEVKKFIKACSDENISVVASVVENYKGRHLNLEKCEAIATELGAKLKVREWIKNGY